MPNTEADEGRYEAMRAYPDDRPSRADLAEESAWWDWWWREGRHQEVDPHGWPREAEGSLLEALHRACEETGR